MHSFDPGSAISRRQLLRSSALFGAGAMAASLPLPAFANDFQAPRMWPGVASMIEDYVGSRKVANMVATMGWGQDAPQIIASGQRAFSGGGAVGPDTLYRIYSMTKPITGMAAMICADEGLLGLDQPIADLLPAFADMQVQKDYDGPITADNLEPARRLITLRHLLTHTAGLGYSIVQQGPIREAYNENGIVPAYFSNLPMAAEFFGSGPAPNLAAFADSLAQLPLVAQPGERWLYSVSLDLLGRVIEVASGEPFDAFLKSRIFEPCGMTSTGFRVAEDDIGRFVTNYVLVNGLPLPVDMPQSSVFLPEPAFPFGGAGLVSTARDYDRFLQMLGGYGVIEGRQVMSEKAVRMGTSDLSPDTQRPENGFEGGVEWGHGAGGISGKQGQITQGLFGWSGAAGTVAMVNMDLSLRMNLMTQYMPPENFPIQRDFPRTVMSDALMMRAR